MNEDEILALMALSRIPGLGCTSARKLLSVCGSALEVFRRKKELPALLEGAERVVELLDCPEAFRWAEQEWAFAKKNSIDCLAYADPRFPARLRECPDAPTLLYFRGETDLNAMRVINMVGTRHSTAYGESLCRSFLRDLKALCPDVLVVSGLAYGIDIHAHRAALEFGFPTVGVLAHGLDRIYPAMHRQTAVEMVHHGGLLTEFPSGTNPDRPNFVMRNRIVAGMADATIVVESAEKGGSLITADIAESYDRDCFAFPGRITDPYSIGCNELIRTNRAQVLTSAEHFVEAMNWDLPSRPTGPVQKELFPELSPAEEELVRALMETTDGLTANELSVRLNLSPTVLNSLLFELQMKGMIKSQPGNRYAWCG
jgi:DNA processing protein